MSSVRLLDLLTNPEIHNKYLDYENDNISLRFISYPTFMSELTLSNAKTGYGKNQYFKTESLSWHPFVYKGKPCLVSSITKSSLGLGGENGYYSGIKAMKKYASLYSLHPTNGAPFEAHAVPINIDIFENLGREELQYEKGCYWLANTYESYLDYNTFGMQYIEYGFMGQEGDFLFNSKGELYYPSNKMRIVVYLPQDIMIDTDEFGSTRDGSSPEKGLHLFSSDPYFIINSEEMTVLKDYIGHCVFTMLDSSSHVLSETDSNNQTKELISYLKASIELLDRCEIRY